jgi:hypothetical protein
MAKMGFDAWLGTDRMTDDRNASPPSGEERLQRSPRGSGNQVVWTFASLGAGLIGFAAIADFIGIGQPGFGERQLALDGGGGRSSWRAPHWRL